MLRLDVLPVELDFCDSADGDGDRCDRTELDDRVEEAEDFSILNVYVCRSSSERYRRCEYVPCDGDLGCAIIFGLWCLGTCSLIVGKGCIAILLLVSLWNVVSLQCLARTVAGRRCNRHKS
jgi:hypothetical protein